MIMHFKSLAKTKLSVLLYINATRMFLAHIVDASRFALEPGSDPYHITVMTKAAKPMIRHYQKSDISLAIPGICDRESTRNV